MSDETNEQTTEDQNTVNEATSATETAQETTEAPTEQAPESDAQSPVEQDDEKGNPSAEAKRYRLRLRDAEAELESTRAAVEALQEQVLSSTLAEGVDVVPQSGNRLLNEDGSPAPRTVFLKHAGDLFTLGGLDKADAMTDGVPDRAKLSEAATQLYAARPELFEEHPPGGQVHQPVSSAGKDPGYPKMTGGGWSDVIRNRG
ncbi:hypothetical protein [Nesterenkonia halobia]|uniref:Uncharacterized protein n=1 Tax=Nesterenkonia halobia TaxID=37922 RepID=A0ABP6RCQ1_9MICC